MQTIDRSESGQPRTRAAILELLKRLGPQDAFALSRHLGVSPMAVRLHLYQLQVDRLVTYQEIRRPLGRPMKRWRLTPAAGRLFPDGHGRLAVDLLGAIREAFGTRGLGRALALYSHEQAQLLRRRMSPGAPLATRLQVLRDLRSRDDYMADLQTAGDGEFILAENHCPISAAASSCIELCEAELTAFRKALGKSAIVERYEHILAGANRCAFRVMERGKSRNRSHRRARPRHSS
jgi:predicted ArsR family transcriptional regulator